MAQLIVQIDGESPVVHELTDDVVTIGRETDNIVMIVDPSVSRRHAEILVSGGQRTLRDLNSANGTTVNDVPVMEKLLAPGDVIHLGNARVIFVTNAKAPVAAQALIDTPVEVPPLTDQPLPPDRPPVATAPPVLAPVVPVIPVVPAAPVIKPVPDAVIHRAPVAPSIPPAPVVKPVPSAPKAKPIPDAAVSPAPVAPSIPSALVAKPVSDTAVPRKKSPPPSAVPPPPVVSKGQTPPAVVELPSSPPLPAAKAPAPLPKVGAVPLTEKASPSGVPPPVQVPVAAKPPAPAPVPRQPAPGAKPWPPPAAKPPPATEPPPAVISAKAPTPLSGPPPAAAKVPPPVDGKLQPPAIPVPPPTAIPEKLAIPVPPPTATPEKLPLPVAEKVPPPTPAGKHWRPELPLVKKQLAPAREPARKPPPAPAPAPASELPLVPDNIGRESAVPAPTNLAARAPVGFRKEPYDLDDEPSFFTRRRLLVAGAVLLLLAAVATGALFFGRPSSRGARSAVSSRAAVGEESKAATTKKFWDQMQETARLGLQQAQAIPFQQYPVMSNGLYDFQIIDDNALDALITSLTTRARTLSKVGQEFALLDKSDVDADLIAYAKEIKEHWDRAAGLDFDAMNLAWAVHERRTRPVTVGTPTLASADVVAGGSRTPESTGMETTDHVTQLANSWLAERTRFAQAGAQIDVEEKEIYRQLSARYKDRFK